MSATISPVPSPVVSPTCLGTVIVTVLPALDRCLQSEAASPAAFSFLLPSKALCVVDERLPGSFSRAALFFKGRKGRFPSYPLSFSEAEPPLTTQ